MRNSVDPSPRRPSEAASLICTAALNLTETDSMAALPQLHHASDLLSRSFNELSLNDFTTRHSILKTARNLTHLNTKYLKEYAELFTELNSIELREHVRALIVRHRKGCERNDRLLGMWEERFRGAMTADRARKGDALVVDIIRWQNLGQEAVETCENLLRPWDDEERRRRRGRWAQD